MGLKVSDPKNIKPGPFDKTKQSFDYPWLMIEWELDPKGNFIWVKTAYSMAVSEISWVACEVVVRHLEWQLLSISSIKLENHGTKKRRLLSFRKLFESFRMRYHMLLLNHGPQNQIAVDLNNSKVWNILNTFKKAAREWLYLWTSVSNLVLYVKCFGHWHFDQWHPVTRTAILHFKIV